MALEGGRKREALVVKGFVTPFRVWESVCVAITFFLRMFFSFGESVTRPIPGETKRKLFLF